MIKELTDFQQYNTFIETICADNQYRDPVLLTPSLTNKALSKALTKDDRCILGAFDGDEIIGIFAFLLIPDEQYMEMVVCLSRSEKAYSEIFNYLADRYAGYRVDCVFNPGNASIIKELQQRNTDFDAEQQKMVLVDPYKADYRHTILEIEPQYYEEYVKIHNDEGIYWTGDRILDALDRFRVVIAVEEGHVVGYTDVSTNYAENEPYDVYVLPEYRNRGIATELLSYAIERNVGHKMMLMVDVNNASAIHTYGKLGFVKTVGNSVTAHLKI